MFTQHGVEQFTRQAASRFWSCNRKSEPQAGLQRAQPPNSTEPSSLCHTPSSDLHHPPTFLWEQTVNSVYTFWDGCRGWAMGAVRINFRTKLGQALMILELLTMMRLDRRATARLVEAKADTDQSCLFSSTTNVPPLLHYNLPENMCFSFTFLPLPLAKGLPSFARSFNLNQRTLPLQSFMCVCTGWQDRAWDRKAGSNPSTDTFLCNERQQRFDRFISPNGASPLFMSWCTDFLTKSRQT